MPYSTHLDQNHFLMIEIVTWNIPLSNGKTENSLLGVWFWGSVSHFRSRPFVTGSYTFLLLITFPSQCTLCVLCLLTALSRMVGTLQISIIIIMANRCYTWAERGTKTKMEIVICMLHLGVLLLVLVIIIQTFCFEFELLLRAQQCFGSLIASGEQRTVGSVWGIWYHCHTCKQGESMGSSPPKWHPAAVLRLEFLCPIGRVRPLWVPRDSLQPLRRCLAAERVQGGQDRTDRDAGDDGWAVPREWVACWSCSLAVIDFACVWRCSPLLGRVTVLRLSSSACWLGLVFHNPPNSAIYFRISHARRHVHTCSHACTHTRTHTHTHTHTCMCVVLILYQYIVVNYCVFFQGHVQVFLCFIVLCYSIT